MKHEIAHISPLSYYFKTHIKFTKQSFISVIQEIQNRKCMSILFLLQEKTIVYEYMNINKPYKIK
jgi:hypothetical protein